MKIKSIAAICKKNKQVVLFNRYSDSGTLSQYIGDGNAVYPISGLPELDEESILTIFDVPEKQREDWLVRYRDIPEGISFEDTDATEKIIEQGNLSIVYSGKTLKPLQTRRGLVFIESRYLSPVSDVLDVLELYERVTPFGAPYIVAKAGFLLQAVIMPCDVISAQFVQRLQELTRQCAVSLDLREQEQERQAAAESAGQFKVDPETGAIIEPETDGLKSSWKVAGGVQYFAIPRMGAKSASGFKRHTKRRRPERRLFFSFQRVPIQAISTILYTTKRKFALFVGGFGLRTTTATPPIPRPSPLCW